MCSLRTQIQPLERSRRGSENTSVIATLRSATHQLCNFLRFSSKFAVLNRFLTLFVIFVQIFNAGEAALVASVRNRAAPSPSLAGYVAKLRGLPYTATAEDILAFLHPLQVVDGAQGVAFISSNDGRPSGEAYIEFNTLVDRDRAMEKHNQRLGTRYVEIFPSTMAELFQAAHHAGIFTFARSQKLHHPPLPSPGVSPIDALCLHIPPSMQRLSVPARTENSLVQGLASLSVGGVGAGPRHPHRDRTTYDTATLSAHGIVGMHPRMQQIGGPSSAWLPVPLTQLPVLHGPMGPPLAPAPRSSTQSPSQPPPQTAYVQSSPEYAQHIYAQYVYSSPAAPHHQAGYSLAAAPHARQPNVVPGPPAGAPPPSSWTYMTVSQPAAAPSSMWYTANTGSVPTQQPTPSYLPTQPTRGYGRGNGYRVLTSQAQQQHHHQYQQQYHQQFHRGQPGGRGMGYHPHHQPQQQQHRRAGQQEPQYQQQHPVGRSRNERTPKEGGPGDEVESVGSVGSSGAGGDTATTMTTTTTNQQQ